MNKITAPDSNYKISKRNEHKGFIYSPEIKKVVIGVPSNFDTETADVELLFNSKVISIDIPDYYSKLLSFSSDKRNAIQKGVDFLINTNKHKIHMGKNFEDVLNYAYRRSGYYLSNAVKGLLDVQSEEELTSKISTIKKMFTTTKFHKGTALLSGYFCAYNLISPSFTEKGEGYIYIINADLSDEEKANIDTQYKEYLFAIYNKALFEYNHTPKNQEFEFDADELYDIEFFLNDVIHLKGKYEKWEINNMFMHVHFDNYYSGMISAMMEA